MSDELSIEKIRKHWDGPICDAFPEFYKHINFLLKELENANRCKNKKPNKVSTTEDFSLDGCN